MSHRVAAFRSQGQWSRIFISLTTPMAIGTQLGFKRHRESLFISVFPKTIISTLLSVIIFTGGFLPLPKLQMLEVRRKGTRSISMQVREQL